MTMTGVGVGVAPFVGAGVGTTTVAVGGTAVGGTAVAVGRTVGDGAGVIVGRNGVGAPGVAKLSFGLTGVCVGGAVGVLWHAARARAAIRRTTEGRFEFLRMCRQLCRLGRGMNLTVG